MENIEQIFLISDKGKRYDQLIDWITSHVFKNKISILERNQFSDTRKIQRTNKKLIAVVIYSPDTESSAWRGPFMKVRIFEKQDDGIWIIDLAFKRSTEDQIHSYKHLDFAAWINEARIIIMRDFINE